MNSFHAFWAGSASASTTSGRPVVKVLGREPSLTDVLASLGMTRTPATNGQHLILDGAGEHVFTGTAIQTWRWLKATGRIPNKVSP